GHGDVDLLEALTVSCNNYFYNLGLALGPDRLSQGALAFGLSQPTGILLGKEAKGLVPSKRWKKAALNQPWYDGETAHFAIGQGYIAVTPIQVARFVSCFANGGYLVSPYVVKGSSEKPRLLSLDPAAIRTVRKGLFRVVNDPSGTGKNAHVEGLAISGKTGTAEVGGARPHGWFCGYLENETSPIALAVFIEHGEQGSRFPAMMAGYIFAWWKENRA
ncbi:MAG: penicillin-binding protein 2, partial [Candidatus Omnitrophica bacterium]|nr:penicillin-binding protein 2 [Candidatus Omnitrophota bacterium]